MRLSHRNKNSSLAPLLVSFMLQCIWNHIIIRSNAFVLPSPSTSFTSKFQSISRNAFVPSNIIHRSRKDASTQLSMCICINCKYVTNCAAYHFVEERHSQPHMTEDPTFTPRDGSPTIHVNIRSQYNPNDSENNQEMKKMWREYKQEEEAAMKKQAEDGSEVVGPTTYNLSNIGEVSYEYDVVKCEDYVEEMGCWVKNMPQEVRMNVNQYLISCPFLVVGFSPPPTNDSFRFCFNSSFPWKPVLTFLLSFDFGFCHTYIFVGVFLLTVYLVSSSPNLFPVASLLHSFSYKTDSRG